MKVLENNPGALNRNNITPKSALISDVNNERRIYDKSEMKKQKQDNIFEKENSSLNSLVHLNHIHDSQIDQQNSFESLNT